MERPTGEGSGSGSSLVPAVSSMVPRQMFQLWLRLGIFYQPVQAYFQFVQNNLMFLDESNIGHIRREAGERHAQLMEQLVQQLRSDFE